MRTLADDLLDRAAAARARGASWDKVAVLVRRSASRVRRWPRAYPDRWSAAFQRAEREFVEEITAESRLTLQSQLRSPDDKIKAAAAVQLLRHQGGRSPRKPKAPAASASAIRLAEYVEGLTDDDLARLLADDAALSAPPAGDAESGAADSPRAA